MFMENIFTIIVPLNFMYVCNYMFAIITPNAPRNVSAYRVYRLMLS